MAILKKLAFLLVLSLSANVFADQVSTVKWKGLNNNSNSVIIDPSEAQDLLNVDVTPTGQSIKKRSGYGLFKALATTKPILGLYHFFDSTGNDVQVAGSSTSLYGIVGGGTPTQLISSATLSSIWDCADSQGSAYCVNSNRNAYVKTNGATMTWYSAPLGTMVETTPDRVVVAGVSGFPNTIYVSESNTFTNFTVGIDATSPFNEVIASPGSKLTHLRYGCGNLLWWKDQSFGVMAFDDQFNVQIRTVSDTIGTFDNTSAIDPGGNVWFRGQDGHTWKYDCSFLTKESIDISPNTQVTGLRISNSWTQTSQSDFQTGVSTPSYAVSFTVSPGDVIVSSFSAIENSSTQWGSGLIKSSVAVNTSSMSAAYVNDPSFESNSSTYWSLGGSIVSSVSGSGCTVSPEVGSYFQSQSNGVITQQGLEVELNSTSLGSAVASYFFACPTSCSGWTRADFSDPAHAGMNWWPGFCGRGAPGVTYNCTIAKSSVTFYGAGSVYYRCDDKSGGGNHVSVDAFIVSTSAFYTSQVYDTGLTSAAIQLQASWTTSSSVPSFSLLSSTANPGTFTTLLTSTGTNTFGNRYVKYTTTFTVSGGDNYSPYLSSATIIARSTGSYYSAVHNSPQFSSWNTLSTNRQDNGGTHSFYVRASTNSYTTTSSTPTWTSASDGGLITASTGTYIQFRDDFSLTSATQTPTLNDFTLNWFEGGSSDQSYITYFDNAIWQSVAFGGGQTTNNYIFKKDLINDAWTVYNFGAGGLAVQANRLYFGDTSAGNVYIYGSATSDNGSAINAYWKGKDFTGQDPFLQNQLNKIDVFCKKDQGSTLTGTYTTDTSTATAYSISLSTSASIVQNRKILPSGKLGYTMNYKLSDSSSSSAWECFGYRMDYNPLPYRPTYP